MAIIVTPGERIVRCLRTPMVFVFAFKFVFPAEGAVGIEVDYIVGEDGIECVTCGKNPCGGGAVLLIYSTFQLPRVLVRVQGPSP